MQLLKKPKIRVLCYVLIFDQVEIIQRSLEFLTTYADQLEIIIIENPSPNTPLIKHIVDNYGDSGLIKTHYLFHENITGNAFDIILTAETPKIMQNPYVLVTDGDLTCSDAGWLNEEISIMRNNDDVFACGVTLDKSNLPLDAFPGANLWIPDDISETHDYYEARTGGHLLLFRGDELGEFMKWKSSQNLNFVDGIMHRYCYEIIQKKWARTKHASAYHMTWDLYKNINHPYTKLKTDKSFRDTWYHKAKSGYHVTNYDIGG